jgi:hypothetical protein
LSAVSLLAHQGGWDEALFVVLPLLFIVWLLRLAKNRAERANPAPATPESMPTPTVADDTHEPDAT